MGGEGGFTPSTAMWKNAFLKWTVRKHVTYTPLPPRASIQEALPRGRTHTRLAIFVLFILIKKKKKIDTLSIFSCLAAEPS